MGATIISSLQATSMKGANKSPVASHSIVLVIAAAFPPDPLSGAARPGRFVKYLPQFGYEPVVICRRSAEHSEGSAEVRRVPSLALSLRVRIAAGAGYYVQRYLLPYNDQLPWAAHALTEAEVILRERPIAAVLSTSPPLATHLVASTLKRRYGIPWVADFRDPLQGNPFRSRKWFFPYDALIERRLFRHADALIANTDTVAEMWRGRHHDHAHKISVIWNGFDPEERIAAVPPIPRKRKVLAHVGSLYGGRHPGRLLSSVVRLIETGYIAAENICVDLIGPYDEHCIRINQQSVDALRALGSLNCEGKQVSKAEAQRAGLQADYLLLLDLNEHDADLQVPAKLFDYIQFGRPILAFTRRDSPTERILKQCGVPYRAVYHDSTDADIDREVCSLLELPSDSVQPTHWYEEQFNGLNQVRTLAGILDRVRGQSSAAISLPFGGGS